MNRKEIHRILSQHKNELLEKYGVLSISIFGSYARNEERHDSDIDVAVELENADLFTMASLNNYLQEILNKNVDVIRIRKNMNPILKKELKETLLMYDKEIVLELLKKIEWSIRLILKRSYEIKTHEDFIKDDEGLTKLDSICMQIINIGEALKEIDKITSNKLLVKYPEIDWKAAKGMRDIITHHYFDIDAEIVFETIQRKFPHLQETINIIIADLT